MICLKGNKVLRGQEVTTVDKMTMEDLLDIKNEKETAMQRASVTRLP